MILISHYFSLQNDTLELGIMSNSPHYDGLMGSIALIDFKKSLIHGSHRFLTILIENGVKKEACTNRLKLPKRAL